MRDEWEKRGGIFPFLPGMFRRHPFFTGNAPHFTSSINLR